ncbi:unnamed protein product [Brassica rapa]|uniref:Uncharacterized protein n=1 Tax=Brassica campestris TaxID=3711 RepID=A0A3P5XWV7_BRACM|nr:unnamed protein product [Brassica rapa]VDC59199.1 unnamed protein product [Brassica rapa]
MEGFARRTTSWRDDETEESIEEEMCRVKREFKSLKSYVSTFTNVRETTIQVLFNLSGQLEGEKAQKKVEVQKLMEENVKLTAVSDKKEAQLLALIEKC